MDREFIMETIEEIYDLLGEWEHLQEDVDEYDDDDEEYDEFDEDYDDFDEFVEELAESMPEDWEIIGPAYLQEKKYSKGGKAYVRPKGGKYGRLSRKSQSPHGKAVGTYDVKAKKGSSFEKRWGATKRPITGVWVNMGTRGPVLIPYKADAPGGIQFDKGKVRNWAFADYNRGDWKAVGTKKRRPPVEKRAKRKGAVGKAAQTKYGKKAAGKIGAFMRGVAASAAETKKKAGRAKTRARGRAASRRRKKSGRLGIM